MVFFKLLLSIVGKPLSKQRMSQQQYRQSATGSFPDILSKGELINFSPFGGLSYSHFPRFRPFRVSVIGSLRCLMSPPQKRRRGGGFLPSIIIASFCFSSLPVSVDVPPNLILYCPVSSYLWDSPSSFPTQTSVFLRFP